jgi:hypothetical protein
MHAAVRRRNEGLQVNLQGIYNHLYRPKMPPVKGSRLCLNQCGRMVSANKNCCLNCLAGFLQSSLEQKGEQVNPDEVKVFLRDQAAGL